MNSNENKNSVLKELSLDYKNNEITKNIINLYKNCLINRDKLNFKITMLFSVNQKDNLLKQKSNELCIKSNKNSIETKYAFTISNTYEKINRICNYGLECNNSDFTCLGPPKKGVYLCLHPDIMLDYVENEYVFLIMHKIIISKTKKFDVDINRDGPEPEPQLYDSHMSKISAQTQYFLPIKPNINELYKNSLIYLFDYDFKTRLFNKKPRQALPIAVFLLKSTSSQPPASKLLKKSLFLTRDPLSPSPSATASSSASTLLNESFEINCKKLDFSVNEKMKIEVIEAETQTILIESTDACVQTDNLKKQQVEIVIEKRPEIPTEIDLINAISEEAVVNNEYEYTEVKDEIIKIEFDILSEANDDNFNLNNDENNDVYLLSPLPAIGSRSSSPLPELNLSMNNEPSNVQHEINDIVENNNEIIKSNKKLIKFERKITKISRKLFKKALDFKFKKKFILKKKSVNKPVAKENTDFYSSISSSSSSTPSTTRSNSLSKNIIQEKPEEQVELQQNEEKEKEKNLNESTAEKHQECSPTKKLKKIPALLSLNVKPPPEIKPPQKNNYKLNIYWTNLYLAFKYLTKGILYIKNALHEIKIMNNRIKTNEYLKLEKDIYKIKFIKNPLDPIEKYKNWIWNYKSSKHYKLIKIKYSLITRLMSLYDHYIKYSTRTGGDRLRNYCVKKMNDYLCKWQKILKDLMDCFYDERPSLAINNHTDLNLVIENDDDMYRHSDCDKHSFEIEQYVEKTYYLLELLLIPPNTEFEFKMFNERLHDHEIKMVLAKNIEDDNNNQYYGHHSRANERAKRGRRRNRSSCSNGSFKKYVSKRVKFN